jgi:hypothetical protein
LIARVEGRTGVVCKAFTSNAYHPAFGQNLETHDQLVNRAIHCRSVLRPKCERWRLIGYYYLTSPNRILSFRRSPYSSRSKISNVQSSSDYIGCSAHSPELERMRRRPSPSTTTMTPNLISRPSNPTVSRSLFRDGQHRPLSASESSVGVVVGQSDPRLSHHHSAECQQVFFFRCPCHQCHHRPSTVCPS